MRKFIFLLSLMAQPALADFDARPFLSELDKHERDLYFGIKQQNISYVKMKSIEIRRFLGKAGDDWPDDDKLLVAKLACVNAAQELANLGSDLQRTDERAKERAITTEREYKKAKATCRSALARRRK